MRKIKQSLVLFVYSTSAIVAEVLLFNGNNYHMKNVTNREGAVVKEFQVVNGRKLRCGYTTGSCAAAAAKAATIMLLTNADVDIITINTPKGVLLNLVVKEILREQDSVTCAIRKDAGDDYDDTNGVLIYAKVKKTPETGITILGGIGVGKVTKPGLSCQVGGPAINPTPLKMISTEVSGVCEKYHYSAGLEITISIPEGAEIAKKTFNPRLGIVGGLSILGTSGIVEPMSETALIKTMQVEMDVQKSKGNNNLLVFFGNYGEDYARDILGLDISEHITCSNFVGELLDYAVYCGFTSLVLIGHSGKLVKLAQGVMNTHSKYADCRTEALALNAMFLGADPSIGREIADALTTDEAIKVLNREKLLEPVMNNIMERIDYYMQHRVHNKLKTGAVMFSNVYGVLGLTKDAQQLINLLKHKD
ncbi:MAG: cobalt-precorrin-5B (C(1))-methyltransferase CbiD [Acidaminococcaceae bacterium]|nr:cobalt-precorrin-5B (C(1))-methyltransferase CbiD [Acidaminococcaceae bacterium]MDD4722909.1 cobalt-precorrin-5B (C(1))-methyltransferase CbiD [Acidaminococcaceae bacterium]